MSLPPGHKGWLAPRGRLSSSPKIGLWGLRRGGRIPTVLIQERPAATLERIVTAYQTAECLERLVLLTGSWWSPIRVLTNCTATSKTLAIRINSIAARGALETDLQEAGARRPRRRLARSLPDAFVSNVTPPEQPFLQLTSIKSRCIKPTPPGEKLRHCFISKHSFLSGG
jgi:hypothetical protein